MNYNLNASQGILTTGGSVSSTTGIETYYNGGGYLDCTNNCSLLLNGAQEIFQIGGVEAGRVNTNGNLSWINNVSIGHLAGYNPNYGLDLLGNAGIFGSANGIVITGGATGVTPSVACTGSDTNVNCNIATKGTGVVEANGDAVVYNVASGTLSVTPGASVGCTDTTATATGAATTNLVSVTPQSVPSADTNISWQGYVSAANTVDIHVCTQRTYINSPDE